MLLLCTLAVMVAACRNPEPAAPKATALTIFAAASTADAVTEAARRYEGAAGLSVRLNLAASSALARQIEAGADADVYISADEQWMDYLQERGFVRREDRFEFVTSELVLIAPAGKGFPVLIERGTDLPRLFTGRLSLADPASVPAGIYAKEALEHYGWWTALQGRLAPAADVRAALRTVELGETDLGVVYATDAATTSKVQTIAVFPESSHSPIRYPIAALASSRAGGTALLGYLSGDQGLAVFEQYGFLPVDVKQVLLNEPRK